jgi:UDP-N-acetylmuramate--alanine ligase
LTNLRNPSYYPAVRKIQACSMKITLNQPRLAHLIGIGGSGMRALATVLLEREWTISGSDLRPENAEGLIARGVRVFGDHASSNVPLDTEVVVYSDAVPADNPERRRADELGIRSCSYAQMLGEIATPSAHTNTTRILAVAGTHGKSTVTAMAAEILIRAGLDPTVICGAAPLTRHENGMAATGGRSGAGNHALFEACEYRENFLHLAPEAAAILNIEPDHFDYYRSTEQLIEAFERFASHVSPAGLLIVGVDSHRAISVAKTCGRAMTTFGLSADADWRAANLQQNRGRYRFELVRHGRLLTTLTLAVAGRHNVFNALAAAALARHCGVSAQQIAQGLAFFAGLKRRLEVRGRWHGTPWVDDYAHHPTEIKAALLAVRQMFPRRRIFCVFQPHQASRLTILLDELAASLQNADKLAVTKVFRARETAPRPGEATAVDLAATVRAGGMDVLDEHSPTAIARQAAQELQPGDVLVTLGAGDLGKIFHEFRQRVGRDRAVA